jgi:hypothetical protein
MSNCKEVEKNQMKLQIGDKLKDNDPRCEGRVLIVSRLSQADVFAIAPDGKERRYAIKRIFTDGKERRTGLSRIQ